jgi:ferric-dicitrate binding protein FerR (iron transport regulator)
MTTEPYDLNDEQWSAIADYISDQATSAAAAAMRAQLATDPAFAAQVAPIVALWDLLAPNRIAARLLAPSPFDTQQPPVGEPPPERAPDHDAVRTAAAWARLEAALPPVQPSPTKSAVRPALTEASQTPRHSRSISPQATPRIARAIPMHTPWWRRPWVVAAGIACLLLLSAGIVFRVRYPTLRYTGGTLGRVVTLPDSSVATLAPGAYLGTSHSYTYGSRDVYLFGQAHFHVAPDASRPFIVHVVGVDATALGTTFDMTSDTRAHVIVQVTQGKISLMIVGSDGVPHPTAVLTAGQVQDIPALTKWMTGAGVVLGSAGVPFATVVQIHNALLRAAATLATPHP